MSEATQQKDLVLAPNEFAFVLDTTKGNITTYVGPHKTSLSQTDRHVLFNYKTKTFDQVGQDKTVQKFCIAPKGYYISLKNPALDDKNKNPKPGTANSLTDLDVGKKINIPGPASFALWPGQMAEVIRGHTLRSNQYLLCKVYDAEAVKIAETSLTGTFPLSSMVVGQLFVIKGTDVSFYIPPTGVDVVPDNHGKYIRDAVTLELLEYCVLLDESGEKRYIKGPDVVFPEPTEKFLYEIGERKFKAVNLNEISGIYVQVIKDYKENGLEYKVGQEIFITGNDTKIYFPREEHGIIKYGNDLMHYAVAIPAGEGRYVLNRKTGDVRIVRGPCMFLPNPIDDVIVRRVLDAKTCALLYPGNEEVLEYNKSLTKVMGVSDYVPDYDVKEYYDAGSDYSMNDNKTTRRIVSSSQNMYSDLNYTTSLAAATQIAAGGASDKVKSESISRKKTFTKPRTIVLDSKYDGVVNVEVWNGYAVLVVDKKGNRRVIRGPKSIMLEYDETLESLYLATGTPKKPDNALKTVFLRTMNNKVSDEIEVETKDLCSLKIKLSYLVDFVGDDPEKWFEVEDYVMFLCEHTRSIVKNIAKQHYVENFYNNISSILRDAVLGERVENKRTGRIFANNMKINDLDVFEVVILDKEIANNLIISQRESVSRAISVNRLEGDLELSKREQKAIREKEEEEAKTSEVVNRLALQDVQFAENLRVKKRELEELELVYKTRTEEVIRALKEADNNLAAEKERVLVGIKADALDREAGAFVTKMEAITPQLISALQAVGDKKLLEGISGSLAPLAISTGESPIEMLTKLLRGLPIADWVTKITK